MHVFPFSLVLSLSLSAVSAYVSLQYPLEDQLPLIARANLDYTWSFAKSSFISSKNDTLEYTALDLPSWLKFDPSALSFHGKPSLTDVGSNKIKVTARDTSDSTSSSFILQTMSTAPPKLHRPVVEQFHFPNPSLSSVFLVSEKSSLRDTASASSFLVANPAPALRIPPKWSFSIGFEYDTFVLETDPNAEVFYSVLQRDGSPLPSWVNFNTESITLDGVTPPSSLSSSPTYLALALHASDTEGFSGASLPFDLYVASHEVSLSSSLPTINVTADAPFSVTLSSPADFSGILLDGEPLKPTDIVTLQVDTSFYGEWLQYDTSSKTLSGDAPKRDDKPTLLPVTIATTVNQTIETNVSLAIVPSYFSADPLQPVLIQAGDTLNFGLTEFFSNATKQDDVALSASFDPEESAQFLMFDPSAAKLSGTVPTNFSTSAYSHVTVSFTAYSHITHSTSHTTLPISFTEADFKHSNDNINAGGSKLSPAARKKLLLGLEITFGIIGGVVLFGLLLAGLRKCAAVPDTAAVGEDGEKAWTAEEKKWYGIGIEVGGEKCDGPGSVRSQTSSPTSTTGGAPLRRIPTGYRGSNERMLSPGGGMMRKADFMGKVKATAHKVSGNTIRVVSDTYQRAIGGSVSNRQKVPKFIIGKPTLIMAEDGRKANADDLSYIQGPRRSRPRNQDPFADIGYAASGISDISGLDDASGITETSLTGSPSSSTAGRSAPSLPRRRPDFAPPLRSSSGIRPTSLTTPPQAHVSKMHAYAVPLTRQTSLESTGSGNGSDGEVAIVQRAERARSIRSLTGRDGSAWSFDMPRATRSQETGKSKGADKPRLVPFTHATRVPVPKAPSSRFADASSIQSGGESVASNVHGQLRTKRVVSQMARVFRSESTERRVSRAEGRENGRDISGDDLSVGIEYVRALGDDASGLSAGLCYSIGLSI
jgi:axial budding pattern protein 2